MLAASVSQAPSGQRGRPAASAPGARLGRAPAARGGGRGCRGLGGGRARGTAGVDGPQLRRTDCLSICTRGPPPRARGPGCTRRAWLRAPAPHRGAAQPWPRLPLPGQHQARLSGEQSSGKRRRPECLGSPVARGTRGTVSWVRAVPSDRGPSDRNPVGWGLLRPEAPPLLRQALSFVRAPATACARQRLSCPGPSSPPQSCLQPPAGRGCGRRPRDAPRCARMALPLGEARRRRQAGGVRLWDGRV